MLVLIPACTFAQASLKAYEHSEGFQEAPLEDYVCNSFETSRLKQANLVLLDLLHVEKTKTCQCRGLGGRG